MKKIAPGLKKKVKPNPTANLLIPYYNDKREIGSVMNCRSPNPQEWSEVRSAKENPPEEARARIWVTGERKE